MKTRFIVVDNSNNYTDYSVLSDKSEAVESGYGFIDIDFNKDIFKWLRYPNRYMYIDLKDRPIHFLYCTIISGTTDDPYDPDNTKVITSGSLIEIINKIKK
jgi:hypothetical protein